MSERRKIITPTFPIHDLERLLWICYELAEYHGVHHSDSYTDISKEALRILDARTENVE
jgi:hypothetical protein